MSRKALLFSLSISVAAGAGMVACGGGNDAAPVASPTPSPGPTPTPAPAPTPTPTPTPAPAPSPPSPPPPPPPAAPFEINVQTPPPATSSGVNPRLTLFATGLSTPWSMAFLPDGRLLVTQKPGQLRLVSADGTTVSAPISGVPTVDARDQGGLLDVAIDPQFATNRRVYLTFSEPVVAGSTNRTAVARGELSADTTALQNVSVIFRQSPEKSSTGHFGSRIVFRPDGTLFVTLGERQGFPTEAQLLNSQLGKVVRINADGSIPSDNPYATSADIATRPIWSYGHRNPQAAALHPVTGELWVAEHGPQGGDEVNVALPMRNFGWPNVSYGCNYGDPVGTNCRYGGGTHNAPYTPPAVFWYPVSTAPGGALFYTGSAIPQWQGSFFVGGLAGKTLWRLVVNGQSVVGQEPFFAGQHEIRDLKQGPDGKVYLISRNTSQIYRIDP